MSDQRQHPGTAPTDIFRTDFQETAVTSAYSEGLAGSGSRPPIRWAGVVWGLILMGFATITLYVASAPERIQAVHGWLSNLDAGMAWALVLAVVGGIIVVFALLGAIRSAQRRQERAGRA